jgi:SulP family sulfate permease
MEEGPNLAMSSTRFNWQTIKGDIIGGITVAFVALPLALSFGVLSGMGAEAGIYGAIFTGILASIFGGTKGQISGPTGAMTVVLVEMFNKHGVEGLIAAMILAGVFQVLMGLFKLGKYIQLIPKPTIIGFTNGIGILIFLKQLEYVKVDPVLAIFTLLIMLGLPFISKKLPAALIALIVGSVVASIWLPTQNVVGEISLAMPKLQIPDFLSLNLIEVTKAAIILALLGAIESLLASLVVDEMTKTKHNSDRELVGQGVANFITAIFGNLIGTGAIIRSAVNINAGGRGRASGVIHAIVLLLLVFQFGSLSANIPLAVLAGILMATAIKMIEYHETYIYSYVSKEALAVISVTTVLTVVTDLTTAVAMGTLLSGLIMIYNMGNSYVKEYPIECDDTSKKIKSFTIEGALFFGVTDSIVSNLILKSKNTNTIIINLMNTPIVDASGIIVLSKFKEAMDNLGTKVILTGLKENTYQKLLKLHILDGSEQQINLGKIGDAIAYVKTLD